MRFYKNSAAANVRKGQLPTKGKAVATDCADYTD
jgi:hypothetical protein